MISRRQLFAAPAILTLPKTHATTSITPGNVTEELPWAMARGQVLFPVPDRYLTEESVRIAGRSISLLGHYANAVEGAPELCLVNSNAEQLLDVHTGIQGRVMGLRLCVDTNTTQAKRIVLQRAGDKPALSSISMTYEGCHFAARGSRPLDEHVWLYDSVLTRFQTSWFTGQDVALRIGATVGVNVGTFGNGNAAGVSCGSCLFAGDVVQQRGWAFAYENCAFQVRSDGDGAVIRPGGHEQDRQVLVKACAFFGGSGDRPSITQGIRGEGLTVISTRFSRGKEIVFNGAGGVVMGISEDVVITAPHGNVTRL